MHYILRCPCLVLLIAQFVSYEDAAYAMLSAAEGTEYDGTHIQALTHDEL